MPKGVYKHKKGYKHSEETKFKISATHKGKKRTLESRLKQSISRIGKKYMPHSEETKRKIGVANSKSLLGKSQPWNSGEKHWNWKGGVNPINDSIRKSLKYKLWRRSVFERDGYTCQICYAKGTELQADHIKPFAYFPELRFELSNGRTLCKECHIKTKTYSNRYKNEYNKICDKLEV